MKKTLKRAGRLLLITLFILGSMQLDMLAPNAKAVTQAEIDELKENASSLDSQQEELQAKIDALEADKSKAMEQVALLNQQNDVLRKEISNAEELISEYENMIAQTQAELEEVEQREAEQYDLFCKRVRAMEEQGTVSYWSVLFNATDFADLLSRLADANEIMAADQRVIDELEALQAEIAEKKAQLETTLQEQQDAKAKLEADKAKLEDQLAEAKDLAQKIEDGIGEYEAAAAALAAEEKRVDAEIKKLEDQLAAELGQGSVGGYIWPVTTSKRITSPYGTRWHPVYQYWKTHNGVDIGGVYYSSAVRATKAGVVIISQYNSSYGNYVVISHGTGNTTLYAHMSSRSVSVGDRVTQGQQIGVTGSTGVSTGPHLHYEIKENGVRVDPLQYMPGYIKAWD